MQNINYRINVMERQLFAFVVCGSITWIVAAIDGTGTHVFYDFWHHNPIADYVPFLGGLVGAIIDIGLRYVNRPTLLDFLGSDLLQFSAASLRSGQSLQRWQERG